MFAGARGDPAGDRGGDGQDHRVRARRRSRSRAAPAARPSRIRPAHKAWQLIDAAGCRGLRLGDAQVSEMHCNFLINLGSATAADIETLGETVRERVKENSGVELEWEIKRIGVPQPDARCGSDLIVLA